MKYEEIENKRDELNNLIEEKAEYNKILKASIELDELIEKYYGINKM